MPLFFKPEFDEPFRRQEVVMTTEELPGVPLGTRGKIKLINGFDWLRYWVFFDNGVELGSIDSSQLVRPQHWEEFQVKRAERLEAEAAAAEAAAAGATATTEASAGASLEGIDPNDPIAALVARVPPRLLEMSAAARIRLGVPKS